MYGGCPSYPEKNPEKFFKIHMDIFVGAGFAEDSLRSFVAGHTNIHKCCRMYSNYDYCMDICFRQESDILAFINSLHAVVKNISHVQWYAISEVLKPVRKKRTLH